MRVLVQEEELKAESITCTCTEQSRLRSRKILAIFWCWMSLHGEGRAPSNSSIAPLLDSCPCADDLTYQLQRHLEPRPEKTTTSPTMATPVQFITFGEVELLHRALRELTAREEYHMKLLRVATTRYSVAEAEVRKGQERERRLKEQCREAETSAEWWENMFNRALSNSKTDEALFRSAEAGRVKAEKAMEEKVKVLQQHLIAKHAKQRDLSVTAEKLHIETLQSEVSDLLKNQEMMEEELIRTTSSAIDTVQHVTAAVLALVAEVEKSQSGTMYGRTVKRNTGRKRQRPAEASKEFLKSTNPLEHSKLECYKSIQYAEEALVDATGIWKTAQSAAESMLAVGRKAILDKIMGRFEAQEQP